jgi:hypothetical protein
VEKSSDKRLTGYPLAESARNSGIASIGSH